MLCLGLSLLSSLSQGQVEEDNQVPHTQVIDKIDDRSSKARPKQLWSIPPVRSSSERKLALCKSPEQSCPVCLFPALGVA